MSQEMLTIIGILLQTAIYLLGGYAMVIRNDGSNKALKEEVAGIQKELKTLATVMTTMAVQSERLNNISLRLNQLDNRVNELHGISGRRLVDGEYPGPGK